MKIGFVSTTMAVASIAWSTEAQIGTSRNLISRNDIKERLIDSTGTGAMAMIDTSLVEGVASATATATNSLKTQETTKRQDLNEEEQSVSTEKSSDQQSKPLPSFDEVMHKDAPSHGKYVEGGSDRARSFCARHNHLGPNSGCEQHHASLRGSRGNSAKDDPSISQQTKPESYLQKHVHEARLQHYQHRDQNRQKKEEDHSDRK